MTDFISLFKEMERRLEILERRPSGGGGGGGGGDYVESSDDSVSDINTMTLAEYNALPVKDPNTLYNITDDGKGTTQLDYSFEEQITDKKWLNGKPIYQKTIDFGALPNNGFKAVDHNISDFEMAIKHEFITWNGGVDNYMIPYVLNTTVLVGVNIRRTDIRVFSNYDTSSQTMAYCTLWYTKA